MSNRLRNNLLKYGIAILVGALMVYAVFTTHGFAEASTQVERLRILSDAFTIPGVILIMVWALVLVANEGIFLGVSYAVSYAVKLLVPGSGAGKQERYGDYIERKKENGKVKGVGFLFFVGLAYLLVAIVCTILFYVVQ